MNKTRYQTRSLSFSLFSSFVRQGGHRRLVPHDVKRRRSTCARAFLRTCHARLPGGEKRVDPTKSSHASLLSLHKNIQHPETLPLALRHYNRITKIRHDLPQIRRFRFFVRVDVTLSLVDYFSISLEAEMVVSGLANVQNNKLQKFFSLMSLYDILKMKEITL